MGARVSSETKTRKVVFHLSIIYYNDFYYGALHDVVINHFNFKNWKWPSAISNRGMGTMWTQQWQQPGKLKRSPWISTGKEDSWSEYLRTVVTSDGKSHKAINHRINCHVLWITVVAIIIIIMTTGCSTSTINLSTSLSSVKQIPLHLLYRLLRR